MTERIPFEWSDEEEEEDDNYYDDEEEDDKEIRKREAKDKLNKSKLGQGSFGIVYLLTDGDKKTALKIRKLDYDRDDEDQRRDIANMISVCKQLKHPNISQLISYGYSRRNKKKFYMELELGGVNLKKFYENNNNITERTFKSIMVQLLRGMSFMHSIGVVHGDLKPENVTYDQQTDKLLIVDFDHVVPQTGLFKEVKEYSFGYVTQYYRAPELLLECGNTELISYGIDVWTIGCIWYEVLNRQQLFKGDSQIDQSYKIFQKLGTPTPEEYPFLTECNEYKKLTLLKWPKPASELNTSPIYSRIFTYDPRKRISSADLLQLSLDL